MNAAELKVEIHKLCQSYADKDTDVAEATDRLFGYCEELIADMAEIEVSEERACAVAIEKIKQAFVEEVPNERGFLWERQ